MRLLTFLILFIIPFSTSYAQDSTGVSFGVEDGIFEADVGDTVIATAWVKGLSPSIGVGARMWYNPYILRLIPSDVIGNGLFNESESMVTTYQTAIEVAATNLSGNIVQGDGTLYQLPFTVINPLGKTPQVVFLISDLSFSDSTGINSRKVFHPLWLQSPTVDLDLNDDGKIDFADILQFVVIYRSDDNQQLDFNQDGEVNVLDYEHFSSLWKSQVGA